jgi:hypothetical protein
MILSQKKIKVIIFNVFFDTLNNTNFFMNRCFPTSSAYKRYILRNLNLQPHCIVEHSFVMQGVAGSTVK